ncbi:hypothetical protein GCM10011352_10490 [Marinobacterium zhoushanense]|uniref:PASTA domain-containing protein n=1 Tax=Marinobacterium zhoushanense TaxID=1679163 RepID=A0ABQ1K4P4_9GAMM|nr:PASTA domain-containing protein [Marinobacterium zhoushanense]GGB86492.1 hypothetical protein GCM10011352_10490 [Marinobacterium zhoushanense]
MSKVVATVLLLTDEGKPAAGHGLVLEAYSLSTRRWQAVARAKTDAQGKASLTTATNVANEPMAPALRLTELGNPSPRVLAQGGYMQFDVNAQTLLVDFGQVERLEETAYRLQQSDSRFARTVITIAGAPVSPQISTLAINRMVAANPRLAAGLTRVDIGTPTQPTAAPQLNEALTAAVLSNKEVQVLKARELQLNSELMDKTREVSLTAEKLNTANLTIDTLRADLGSVNAEKLELAQQLEAIRAKAKEPAKIEDVLVGLGSKLHSSNTQLKKDNLPFRIGSIKVDLRGSLTDDGSSIVMGGSGGGVSTELFGDDAASAETKVTVPAVVGLTETAARRVLRSVGLRMTAAHQQLGEGKGVPGQALSQHPAASTQLAHGSEVMVVFGELKSTSA